MAEKDIKKESPKKKNTTSSSSKSKEVKHNEVVKTTTKKPTTSTKTTKTTKNNQKNELKPLNNMIKLPAKVFAIENVNTQAIFDTVLMERNSRRQGTHSVKTRAEVSGTGKKPWRQKGTGKARAGSLRSPHFVGGGRAFGPQAERNYNIKVNKKVRKLAFFSALTLLAKSNSVLVTDSINLNEPKTKELVNQLQQLGLEGRKHILVVTSNENVYKSANNIPNVAAIKVTSLTVEALLWTDALILNNEDLKFLEGMAK